MIKKVPGPDEVDNSAIWIRQEGLIQRASSIVDLILCTIIFLTAPISTRRVYSSKYFGSSTPGMRETVVVVCGRERNWTYMDPQIFRGNVLLLTFFSDMRSENLCIMLA